MRRGKTKITLSLTANTARALARIAARPPHRSVADYVRELIEAAVDLVGIER